MAGRIQKELEIVLLNLEIPSLKGIRHSTHIFQAALIWPRCGIARKSCEKELELTNGAVDLRQSGWCSRILFKEVVESNFGLETGLTTSLNRSELASFGRFVAGRALEIGADEIEDLLPAGELASLPIVYFSKNLLKNKTPELIVRGNLDLNSAGLDEAQTMEMELPLFSKREQVRKQRLGGRKDPIRYTRKTLLEIGAPDGRITIGLRVLKSK